MKYSLTGTCVHWLRAVSLNSRLFSKEKPELVIFYGYPFAIAGK